MAAHFRYYFYFSNYTCEKNQPAVLSCGLIKITLKIISEPALQFARPKHLTHFDLNANQDLAQDH